MGITVTGAGVSQWNDASGNGRHLLQGTDANRPPLQADGTILFDGVAHFLKCSSFTFAQPETIYLLLKQVSYTLDDDIFDGDTGASGMVEQKTNSPEIDAYAGTASAANANLAIGAYGIICVVFNGANSVLQVNNTAPTTGNFGASNMGGFNLGSRVGSRFANIQVKEAILCTTAHDGTRRAQTRDWLNSL